MKVASIEIISLFSEMTDLCWKQVGLIHIVDDLFHLI